jgi:protein phosphatase PTC7
MNCVKSFNLLNGSSNIPHYKKKETGGEDSFLIIDDLVMVADGVGGWAGKGIDPSLYSKELRDQ